MKLKKAMVLFSLISTLGIIGCGDDDNKSETFTQVKDLEKSQKSSIIKTALTSYAEYAISSYTKAKEDAVALKSALIFFTNSPTVSSLEKAKNAWLESRESYGITEILRLSNGPIDGEDGFAGSFGAPEGQLNAWPLDENMIDYTSDSNGKIVGANIINTVGKFKPSGGDEVDATTITKEVLASLNENGGDANVATGYHAIEFLLWGQDQDNDSFIADNITNGALRAGERPLSDYTDNSIESQRRKDYLNACVELIVDNLDSMIKAWTTGGYKIALLNEGSNAISQTTALKQIFGGMGVFLKSELANERIAVAALTPSEEDEHSCFSDNTHRDIALNYQGFKNILDIFKVNLSDSEQSSINKQETSIDAKVKIINDIAKSTYHFDYQINEANNKLQNIVDTKNEMRDLGDEIINVASEYGISLNESDVTDAEETEI